MTPEALAALHQQCFTAPRPWSAGEFAGLLAGPGTFLLTRAHAFLLGRIAGPEAELLTLAVAPDHRRQGLAATLVGDFAITSRNRGATEAFLEVAADNIAARALYSTSGFQQVATRSGYYTGPDGITVAAIVMRRSLAGG
ncbi:MAG: GNAT family N-acetyltransferase [Rhodobacteraceae bacterium]|nr:GNAT family N-acetyltransferase [Paracoccaceae bacterium]